MKTDSNSNVLTFNGDKFFGLTDGGMKEKQLETSSAVVQNIQDIIYIQSNEIHNVVALIKFQLVLRFQLYMFRTSSVHPQELLCRYCICRLWYVVRSALPDTYSWYNVVPAGRIG